MCVHNDFMFTVLSSKKTIEDSLKVILDYKDVVLDDEIYEMTTKKEGNYV